MRCKQRFLLAIVLLSLFVIVAPSFEKNADIFTNRNLESAVSIQLLYNYTFNTNYYPIGAVARGDINGDLVDEIVLIHNGYIHFIGWNGSAFTTLQQISITESLTLGIELYDFDKDGDLDLFAGGSSDNVYVYRNDGGTFSLNQTISIQHLVKAMALGNTDGDQHVDLVVGTTLDSGSYSVWIYEFDEATGLFNLVWYSDTICDDVNGIAVGDLTDDAKDEIGISAKLNTTSGYSEIVILTSLSDNSYSVAIEFNYQSTHTDAVYIASNKSMVFQEATHPGGQDPSLRLVQYVGGNFVIYSYPFPENGSVKGVYLPEMSEGTLSVFESEFGPLLGVGMEYCYYSICADTMRDPIFNQRIINGTVLENEDFSDYARNAKVFVGRFTSSQELEYAVIGRNVDNTVGIVLLYRILLEKWTGGMPSENDAFLFNDHVICYRDSPDDDRKDHGQWRIDIDKVVILRNSLNFLVVKVYFREWITASGSGAPAVFIAIDNGSPGLGASMLGISADTFVVDFWEYLLITIFRSDRVKPLVYNHLWGNITENLKYHVYQKIDANEKFVEVGINIAALKLGSGITWHLSIGVAPHDDLGVTWDIGGADVSDLLDVVSPCDDGGIYQENNGSWFGELHDQYINFSIPIYVGSDWHLNPGEIIKMRTNYLTLANGTYILPETMNELSMNNSHLSLENAVLTNPGNNLSVINMDEGSRLRIVNGGLNTSYSIMARDTTMIYLEGTSVENLSTFANLQSSPTVFVKSSNINYGSFKGPISAVNSVFNVIEIFSNAFLNGTTWNTLHDHVPPVVTVNAPSLVEYNGNANISWDIVENVFINGMPNYSIEVLVNGTPVSFTGNSILVNNIVGNTTVLIRVRDHNNTVEVEKVIAVSSSPPQPPPPQLPSPDITIIIIIVIIISLSIAGIIVFLLLIKKKKILFRASNSTLSRLGLIHMDISK